MSTIGIFGLGLIGGCLGLDLRSRGYQVLGVSRRQDTCDRAVSLGAVDRASVDPSLLAPAEMIFLCTPIEAIAPAVKQLLPFLDPKTILTDVGSVKQAVVDAVVPLWSNFVPAHPMAGKAENGLQASQKDLFVDRPYVITPVASTPAASIAKVEAIARSLRSWVYQCSPANHDRAVAWISHLPVMVSASLLAACSSESDSQVLDLAYKLASSGFYDTSRVGGGYPELGVMMAKYNQHQVLQALYAYRDRLNNCIESIEQANWSGLEATFEETRQIRDRFFPPENRY
ncbi:prephenate/arogenate dehydrogenase [Geitlerinema sp. PCC 9228]|jgi:arogenate dehydrogenase (NADP+)|uniref:prephenate/arogenate dehydrogenase n=1 Tax=Geitlerinema sp. PCC 9228 TaxID=111611 RepID=UPI0008F9B047|nr:prephenate/arogenate dehydrogenase [Geitlerinema sp. PCC 9228]